MSRHLAISLASNSGVRWVRPVMMPRPPALETAEASSAKPTKCMPPWMIGCLMPNNSVIAVFIETLSRCRCCFTQRFAADHAPARAQGLGLPKRFFGAFPMRSAASMTAAAWDSDIPPEEKSGEESGLRALLYKPLPGVYIAGQRALSARPQNNCANGRILHETRLYPADHDLQPQSGR